MTGRRGVTAPGSRLGARRERGEDGLRSRRRRRGAWRARGRVSASDPPYLRAPEEGPTPTGFRRPCRRTRRLPSGRAPRRASDGTLRAEDRLEGGTRAGGGGAGPRGIVRSGERGRGCGRRRRRRDATRGRAPRPGRRRRASRGDLRAVARRRRARTPRTRRQAVLVAPL